MIRFVVLFASTLIVFLFLENGFEKRSEKKSKQQVKQKISIDQVKKKVIKNTFATGLMFFVVSIPLISFMGLFFLFNDKGVEFIFLLILLVSSLFLFVFSQFFIDWWKTFFSFYFKDKRGSFFTMNRECEVFFIRFLGDFIEGALVVLALIIMALQGLVLLSNSILDIRVFAIQVLVIGLVGFSLGYNLLSRKPEFSFMSNMSDSEYIELNQLFILKIIQQYKMSFSQLLDLAVQRVHDIAGNVHVLQFCCEQVKLFPEKLKEEKYIHQIENAMMKMIEMTTRLRNEAKNQKIQISSLFFGAIHQEILSSIKEQGFRFEEKTVWNFVNNSNDKDKNIYLKLAEEDLRFILFSFYQSTLVHLNAESSKHELEFLVKLHEDEDGVSQYMELNCFVIQSETNGIFGKFNFPFNSGFFIQFLTLNKVRFKNLSDGNKLHFNLLFPISKSHSPLGRSI